MDVKLITLICLTSLSLIVLAESEMNAEKREKCHFPERPGIPNGLTATEQEMIESQKNVKAYINSGDKYLQCIAMIEQDWGKDVTPEKKQLVDSLHNKMVDSMESTADLFNSSLRAYKGKN